MVSLFRVSIRGGSGLLIVDAVAEKIVRDSRIAVVKVKFLIQIVMNNVFL